MPLRTITVYQEIHIQSIKNNINTLSASGNEEIADSSRVEKDDLLEWETLSGTSNSTKCHK